MVLQVERPSVKLHLVSSQHVCSIHALLIAQSWRRSGIQYLPRSPELRQDWHDEVQYIAREGELQRETLSMVCEVLRPVRNEVALKVDSEVQRCDRHRHDERLKVYGPDRALLVF